MSRIFKGGIFLDLKKIMALLGVVMALALIVAIIGSVGRKNVAELNNSLFLIKTNLGILKSCYI